MLQYWLNDYIKLLAAMERLADVGWIGNSICTTVVWQVLDYNWHYLTARTKPLVGPLASAWDGDCSSMACTIKLRYVTQSLVFSLALRHRIIY
jgi:hypothetical protein